MILAAALAAVSCGGGGSNNAPPTTPNPGGSVTIITITSSGTDPRNPTVPLGTRIRWVNNDNRPHEMSSDPHPEHDICSEINGGVVAPGASKETQNLVRERTCAYHDHLFPDTASLKGTITIR